MLKEIFFRVLCCAILCSIILYLLPDSRTKSLIRSLSGVILTIGLLSPVLDIQMPELREVNDTYLEEGRFAAEVGTEYSKQQTQQLIKDYLEAYILDIGNSLGCTFSVHIAVDERGYPTRAEISGQIPAKAQEKLEEIFDKELGIAKEDLDWNGQQTRLQSSMP